MSIDSGFDPTRPRTETPTSASTSLKEDPIPHLDLEQSYDDADLGAAAATAATAEDVGRSFAEIAQTFASGLANGQLTERAGEIDKKVRGLVEKHPVGALAAAAVAGFFIGRIVTRV